MTDTLFENGTGCAVLGEEVPAKTRDMTFSLDEELAFMMYLARDVLGYTDLTKLHVEWFREVLTSPKLLFLAPRDHFKTTCLSIVYPLYRILRDRTVRVMIINEILDNAKDFLSEIKTHIESNDQFIENFGSLNAGSRKWTEKQIALKSDRMRKDPTIAVSGTLGTITSKHVDLLIIDDPVSNTNSRTLGQREKIREWFLQTVLPVLVPDGQLIITGTRWHNGDLYSNILRDNDGQYDDFRKVTYEACDENLDNVLFPERYSREVLEAKRKTMGKVFFNAQFRNDPSGTEGQSFDFDWLQFYQTPPAEMNVYQGIDLAISKNDDAAFFALVTIGVPSEGDIYVLDIHRERLSFPEQCKLIKAKARKFHPVMIGIENNAYQDAMPQWMRADPEAKRLSIHPFPAHSDKIGKLASLSVLFSEGTFRIKEEMHVLIDEYLTFPKGSTFDVLDALFNALEASRGFSTQPTITEINL